MTTKHKILICTPVHRKAHPRMIGSRAKVARESDAEVSAFELHNESMISRARNVMAGVFLATDNDWLYFWDDDITDQSEGNLLDMLLSHERPFIGGLYSTRIQGKLAGRTLETAPIERCMEVKYLGAGSMLVHRSVFEAIARPELEYDHINDDGTKTRAFAFFHPFIRGREYLSEDYAFCQRWQNAGGQVYADLDVKLAHWHGKEAYYMQDPRRTQ